MSETPKAAELSAKYPNSPLGLLFAVQDLEREAVEYREAIESVAFLATTHPHLWNPKMQRAYFIATRKK